MITPTTPLSKRQSQVVRCILDGLCNKEIARALGIEVRTVKLHKHHVYRKFDITSQWIRDVRLVYLLSGGAA